MKMVRKLGKKDEKGQGLVEYALLLILVGIVVIAVLVLYGNALYQAFAGIIEAFQLGCGQAGEQTFKDYSGAGGVAPGSTTTVKNWPTEGTVTQGFNFCHKGLDIANNEGTPIKSVADGTVVASGWSSMGYGNMVVINHGQFQTLYGHLSKRSVHTGDSVTAGQKIGEMGNTGCSTGTHLHFEVRWGSELKDPGQILP